jgi:hypothetical protein
MSGDNSEQTSEATARPEVRGLIDKAGAGAGTSSESRTGGAGVGDSINCGTVKFAPQAGQSMGRPLSVTSHSMC